MQKTTMRTLLPVALVLTLGACSGEPEAEPGTRTEPTQADTATAAKGADSATATPTPAPTVSAFVQALRAISNGNNVRFETEVMLSDGSTQYAIGAGSVRNASFVLRTLPQSSAEFDGNWLFQGNRYLRESGTGFDVSSVNPAAVDMMFTTVLAIPKVDSALADGQGTEMVGAVECTIRKVDLSKEVGLMQAYKSIDVCVDPAGPNLIRLKAETQTGERLTATFSGHGESMELPKTQVKDWSQEYPLR